jgi:hypothetical protein
VTHEKRHMRQKRKIVSTILLKLFSILSTKYT